MKTIGIGKALMLIGAMAICQNLSAKSDNSKNGNHQFFGDITITGSVQRVGNSSSVNRADAVVHKGLGIYLSSPEISPLEVPSQYKNYETNLKNFHIWLGTNMKNVSGHEECSQLAHQARKSDSKLKVSFNNFPLHTLFWANSELALRQLKAYFQTQIKQKKVDAKSLEERAHKFKHMRGKISANVDVRKVSCELVSE